MHECSASKDGARRCSELRSVRVSVHCGVHAIGRNVLKVVEVVREDVRIFP